MGIHWKTSLAIGLLAVSPAVASAEVGRGPLDPHPVAGTGSYQDPWQRAAESYARGARAKRRAEAAKDAKERRNLYERARIELTTSVAQLTTFEALLALGQVDLALGEWEAAATACKQARVLNPGDAAAKACVEEVDGPEVPETERAVPPPALPRQRVGNGSGEGRPLP
jgi:hypothetical protein